MFVFSQRSLENLKGVHPDLARLAHLALSYSELDFAVTEGVRSYMRQVELYQESKEAARKGGRVLTNTTESKHLIQPDGYSHAIDVAVWLGDHITYKNKHYGPVVQAFIRAAIELEIQIRFGHLWRGFRDSCHIELAYYV